MMKTIRLLLTGDHPHVVRRWLPVSYRTNVRPWRWSRTGGSSSRWLLTGIVTRLESPGGLCPLPHNSISVW